MDEKETSETEVQEVKVSDKSSAGVDISRGPQIMDTELKLSYRGARPKTTSHSYYTRSHEHTDGRQDGIYNKS